MRPSAEFITFVVGVGLLSFFYSQVKAAFESDPLFFAAAVVYFIALRFVGKGVAALLGTGRQR